MTADAYEHNLWLILLFVILGYICNILANAILLYHLDIDLYGDFSCAWRALNLFAQIMLLGSNYARYQYSDRKISLTFLASHRGKMLRSFFIAFLLYCLFWLGAFHIHRHNPAAIFNYHLVYFVSVFSILQACIILLNRAIVAFGYPVYSRFLSDFLPYALKFIVLYVGFQLYQPTSTSSLITFIICFLVLTILCEIFSIQFFRQDKNRGKKTPSMSHSSASGIYTMTWKNMKKDPALASLVASISIYAPIYIIEIFSPFEHLVGLYSLCLILVSFVELILLRITEHTNMQLVSVKNTSSSARKKTLQKNLNLVAGVRLLIIFAAYLLYIAFHSNIFSVFSIYNFDDKKLIAAMLAIVYFQDLANQHAIFLYSHQKTSYCLLVNFLSTIIMIVLGIAFIIPYSLMGLVSAGIITQITRVILLSFATKKQTTLRLNLIR